MSDRASDLGFKLKHILIAVKDVATEWHELGLHLDLPEHILKPIDSNPDVEGHLRMMLSKWLGYDPKASWDKLVNALNTMGKNAIAANIRSKYVRAVSETITEDSRSPATDQEETKARQEMTQTVILKIRRQFASLQVEVRSAMEARQVKVSDVHQFLVSFFQSECCIPEAPDLTKLFNIITEAKLWRYDHYGPLEELTEAFLPDDNPARKLVSKYKDKLSGFYVATKIVDFIDLSELDDSDDDSDDDSEGDAQQESLSSKEYKKLYRKLKVTLKLDRTIKFSDMTMSYIDTLWKALIEKFNLPPLTAVIKKIVPGSLIIIWLVPPHVSTVIAASYSKALRFYQQHNIVQVELDGRILYDEDWIADSTPLYQASFMGNTDEVKDLLEGGADVNEQNCNEYGDTALIGACRGGHAETARILLDHGINMDCQNKKGQSALWCASSAGETECVKVLVKYGAQVDLSDKYGNTALIQACQCGHVETARVLLDHGANIDHQNNVGESALWYAGKTECVKVLVKYGAQVDLPDEKGNTALIIACQQGHVKTARVLLDHGANVDHQNNDGRSTLWCASDADKTECVKVLVKYGAQVDLPDKSGNTALIKACWNGHVETARVLLDHGANVDHQDIAPPPGMRLHYNQLLISQLHAMMLRCVRSGRTALYWAAREGYDNIVQMLVDYSAAVDLGRDEGGRSALWGASFAGETECVKVLMKYGAQVDLPDVYGDTALIQACRDGFIETARVLLDHGANVDHQNNRGETALNLVCFNEESETVGLLLKAGAKTDVQEEGGQTALYWAAYRGHVEEVKMLVKYGAAVDIRNKNGLTALDVARGYGYQAVCEVLEQYTKEETRTDLTEEQRESIYQKLLKTLERTFLKEQAKKREEQPKKEHHHQREERVREEREKRSLWSRLTGRRNRPGQIVGTAPAPEK